jgi:predicted ATPase/class 3 adenylate cyclase
MTASDQGEAASALDAVRAPGGTETYLFADIEGSTRLLQRLGEGFAAALVRQRRLLLSAVTRFGGEEDAKERGAAGDGSFIVFRRPRQALLAVVAAQRALAAEPWPEGAEVRVRMGLHTGESEVADGIYTGLDVFRAARITAAAHGGQVLLSDTTRQLVDRDLPPGVALRDLGTHALKDLERPERLWQVVIEGLDGDFPPPRTVSVAAADLPTPPTPLLGREQEVGAVRSLLGRDGVRIVTLTGPGGTGKTRLALEAAAGLGERYPDGVHFVSLASEIDPGQVIDRIAEALAVTAHGARTLRAAVEARLRDRRTLLVLDNFEQVAAGGGLVATLLEACSRLSVLVTSRVVLRLRGEHEFRVPPLGVPDPRRVTTALEAAAYPAVALFVERARAARAEFALDDDNAASVARVCADLDGLPLAIELAAARVKLFTPQALVARLGRRLDLLRGGAVDLPERQQTLRQAIAWSYDLLARDEQAVFRRLAAFRGGASLDAIEAVAGAPADLASGVEDAVAALLDHSLLQLAADAVGEPRVTMLETIGSYALEQLEAVGEATAVRDAHARWCLALAEAAEPHVTGRDQAQWLTRLAAEHDNLRRALDWLEASGSHATALRLGAALWRFWTSHGLLGEGAERLERLLAAPEAGDHGAVRARALHGVGTMHAELSAYEPARRRLEEALGLWRTLGDEAGRAVTLNSLAWMEMIGGRVPLAEALATEAMVLTRALGSRRGEAVALHNLAWIALHGGRLDEARTRTEAARALRREAGDRRGEAYMDVSLGHIDVHAGRYDEAAAHVERGHRVLREIGDIQIGAWALQVRGRIEFARGEHALAAETLLAARAMWEESGNVDALARTLADLAELELERGAPETAERWAEESLAIADRTSGLGAFTNVLPIRASVAVARGDLEGARRHLARAQALGSTAGLLFEVEVWEAQARLSYAEGDLRRMVHSVVRAMVTRERIGAPLRPSAAAARHGLLEAGRGALGDDAFGAASREGTAAAAAVSGSPFAAGDRGAS